MSVKSAVAIVTLLVSSLIAPSLVLAAEPVSKSRFRGVAIGGHDTTAYHALEQAASAVPGDGDHVVEYKGATWRFVDAESAARFEATPEQFSPAYNGHCANALSLGEGLVKTDGAHWEIFEDQLYLFYAARGRTRWMQGDWQAFKQDADKAWATLSR